MVDALGFGQDEQYFCIRCGVFDRTLTCQKCGKDKSLPSKKHRYWITKVLGGGAFGNVYAVAAGGPAARKPSPPRDRERLVLKCPRLGPKNELNLNVIALFKDEYRTLETLGRVWGRSGHPVLFDSVEHVMNANGTSYQVTSIVTLFIGGDTLLEEIQRHQRQGLPRRRIWEVGINLGIVIATLNDMGCAHGDIKPDNIKVRPKGDMVLLDFGLATPLARGGLIKAGTHWYSHSDQTVMGKRTERTELYSLGCVLAHCIVGDIPEPWASSTDEIFLDWHDMVRANGGRASTRFWPRACDYIDMILHPEARCFSNVPEFLEKWIREFRKDTGDTVSQEFRSYLERLLGRPLRW